MVNDGASISHGLTCACLQRCAQRPLEALNSERLTLSSTAAVAVTVAKVEYDAQMAAGNSILENIIVQL